MGRIGGASPYKQLPPRVTYSRGKGSFTPKGTAPRSGPVSAKPHVITTIKPNHPSLLVRKQNWSSVKTPGTGKANASVKAKRTKPSGEVKRPVPHRPLTPKQRDAIKSKIENRTATKQEYQRLQWDRRFKKLRAKAVRDFWKQERNLLKSGKPGTRNWTDVQKNTIISGKVPKFDGKPIEGHHKYNAIDYPHLAGKGSNIYPATKTEHLYRWHGGSFRNDTQGVPNNPYYMEDF